MDNTSSALPFVDEQGLADQHPTLFHYTKMENFEKILKTGGLLTTPYNATNDTSELRAAENILRPTLVAKARVEILADYAAGNIKLDNNLKDIMKILDSDFTIFYKSIITAMPMAPQIGCFSVNTNRHHEENGILTMWRLYAGNSERIAIGFDTRKLIDQSEHFLKNYDLEFCYFDKVSYHPDCIQTLSRMESNGVRDIYYETVITIIRDRLASSVPGNDKRLMELFVLNNSVKHPDFEDEREVRLILAEAESGQKPVPVKHGSRVLFPCLPAINQIIVGPSSDQQAVAAKVKKWSREKLKWDVPVRISETPFRDT